MRLPACVPTAAHAGPEGGHNDDRVRGLWSAGRGRVVEKQSPMIASSVSPRLFCAAALPGSLPGAFIAQARAEVCELG